MSSFAAGGSRNATRAVAPTNATTDTLSASRQGLVEEYTSGGAGKGKPLLRLATQPDFQTSLAKEIPDSTARQATSRGIARASLWLDQATFRGIARASLWLNESTTATLDDAESVDNLAPQSVNGRISPSPSTGSTIVAEDPQTIPQSFKDVVSESESVKFMVHCTSLQNRIAELEKENAERMAELEEVKETARREKAEFQRVHATETKSQRREQRKQQQSLKEVQRQAGEAEERVNGLERQIEVLRREITAKDEDLRGVEVQVRDLTSANAGLEDTVQRLETQIGERDERIEELQSRNDNQRDLLEKRRDERTKDTSAETISRLEAEQVQATTTISTLQLTISSATIHQLRSSLESTSHDNGGLANALEDRTVQVQPLPEHVTNLQDANRKLEQKLHEVEVTSRREKAEFQRVHEARISQWHEHQQFLAEAQRQAREAEDKAIGLERQLEVLRGEITTGDGVSRGFEVQVRDITSINAGLKDTVQRLETQARRRDRIIEELQSQKDGVENERQLLEKRKAELEATLSRTNTTSQKVISKLEAEHARATATVSTLQSSLESLQLDMSLKESKVTELTREKNALYERVGKLGERCKSGEQQIATLGTELANANALVKDLEGKDEVAREEKMILSNRVNELRRQLEGTRKESGQRQVHIQRLAATKEDLIQRAQTSVSDKEATIQELQQKNSALEESRENLEGQLDEAKGKATGLEHRIEILRGEITTRDKASRGTEVQVRDITSINAGLEDTVHRLETQVSRRDRTIEELQSQKDGAENEGQLLEKRRGELEATLSRTNATSQKAISKLEAEYTRATATISTLQNDLSTSSGTIHQLRSSLDSTSHDNSDLTRALEDRTVQYQRLLEHVTNLQGANKTLEQRLDNLVSQMKSAENTAATERAQLCKKYTADIDAERRISRNVQSSLESLQLKMGVTESKVTELTREKNALHERFGKLGERFKSGEQQIVTLGTELANANALVKHLEGKVEVAREEARKAKTMLSNQADELRRQLDGARKESGQHQVQIQRLEATKDDLTRQCRHAQTTVSGKDAAIQELQQKNSALEESKEKLEERLVDMERTLDEANKTVQCGLDRTNQGHERERETERARSRIQELQAKLSSFSATTKQLHASLDASHSDAQKAQQVVEEQAKETHRLQQQVVGLQDAVGSLKIKNHEIVLQMRSKEQAAREEKAAISHSHAAEMQAQRTAMQSHQDKLERNLESKIGVLVGENATLHTEVNTMKERSLKNEEAPMFLDVLEMHKTLVEKAEEKRVKAEEEAEAFSRRVQEVESKLKEREEELEKLKMPAFRKVTGGVRQLWGASTSATKSGQSLVG